MEFAGITPEIRSTVNHFLIDHWFSTDMVIRGEVVDLSGADGFTAVENGELIGLVTYRINENECEILSLDSEREGQGIGSALLKLVIETALVASCQKAKLITTNDNLEALCFYQKRGFRLTGINRNALSISRQLKPSIPLIGMHGIPLRDEIEMECLLFSA